MENLTPADKAYFDIIDAIVKYGEDHKDRTGVGTKRLFGHLVRFDLMESFPIITCKQASFKNTLAELLWFISGCDNINNLYPSAQKWWSPFCVDKTGWIGPMYNKQLTNHKGEDIICKIKPIIKSIPLHHGINFIKEDVVVNNTLDKKLKKTWLHIIDRCYNPQCKEYEYYGKKGIFLSEEWHSLSTFLKEVKLLPNWYEKYRAFTLNQFNELQLDKDYYQSNCYSKESCVWLSISDNNLYRDGRLFKRSDGVEYISKTKAAQDLGVSGATQISRVLNKKRAHCKNYSFDYINDLNIYRYKLPTNQFHNLIKSIKNDSNSRRHLLTTYNPLEAPFGGLYPCHGLTTQFMVDNSNRLHMSTLQRSADVGCGLQHNWISYSLLLIMISILTDKVPGVLTYYMNDLHIYNNHIEPIKNMERKSYSNPQLEIKDDVRNIEDFTMDHFNLINYKSGPTIKLPLAV